MADETPEKTNSIDGLDLEGHDPCGESFERDLMEDEFRSTREKNTEGFAFYEEHHVYSFCRDYEEPTIQTPKRIKESEVAYLIFTIAMMYIALVILR